MKTRMNAMIFGLMGAALLASCNPAPADKLTKSGLDKRDFRTMVNGDSTALYVLNNSRGMEVCITNYGGRIVSLMVPDVEGQLQDVVLGFDRIEEYTSQPSSFGATVGRFANRINKGAFMLDGNPVQLDINSGIHSIHGGKEGWQYQVFGAAQHNDSTLVLSYTSTDGEGGFPGEVKVAVSFTVTQRNELAISYEASTTKNTVINMTNHSFFNLSGDPRNAVLNDVLYVNADRYTPLDTTLIPTGELLAVADSPFDFNRPLSIGTSLMQKPPHTQLQIARGIDHNFVLNTNGSLEMPAARLYSPKSGIAMEVYTNEPGLQVYTGNMLDGSRVGKNGIPYGKQSAVCLESQHFPDSPNKTEWPSTFLSPGEVFKSSCVYRFSTVNDQL